MAESGTNHAIVALTVEFVLEEVTKCLGTSNGGPPSGGTPLEGSVQSASKDTDVEALGLNVPSRRAGCVAESRDCYEPPTDDRGAEKCRLSGAERERLVRYGSASAGPFRDIQLAA